MISISFNALETGIGVFIGLVAFSFSNAIGASIADVYFKPWLKTFKKRHHDKIQKV